MWLWESAKPWAKNVGKNMTEIQGIRHPRSSHQSKWWFRCFRSGYNSSWWNQRRRLRPCACHSKVALRGPAWWMFESSDRGGGLLLCGFTTFLPHLTSLAQGFLFVGRFRWGRAPDKKTKDDTCSYSATSTSECCVLEWSEPAGCTSGNLKDILHIGRISCKHILSKLYYT